MPLPNQSLSQHAVNASSLIIQPIPKYVFDQLNYPHQEEMEAAVFLERHPCFSKVTITPQGEYLLSCFQYRPKKSSQQLPILKIQNRI
ncbi:MAG: hypothetical protein KBF71_02725 [Alphaproteobacteria bacterium]|nr:hypothetical protein [Alphaproteobacteria bacterium]